MMQRTIVCLANSYKHGGRCVAGVCIETGEWLRLRGKAGDGALTLHECALAEGAGEVRLKDIFTAGLHYAMPSPCHPEDWAVSTAPWRLVKRPCPEPQWNAMLSAALRCASGPLILGGSGDRIGADELLAKPAKASLTLVCPENLWWWIREDHGKRKNRALFHHHHITYDLAVTDPRWVDQMNLLPEGIYPHVMLAPGCAKTWLTISLSEAFHPRQGGPGWHFRIVAAVLTT